MGGSTPGPGQVKPQHLFLQADTAAGPELIVVSSDHVRDATAEEAVEEKIRQATGKTGYFHLNPDHLLKRGYSDIQDDGHGSLRSPEAERACDLIQRLLRFDPAKRLPLAEIKAHPYFTESDFQWPEGGQPLRSPMDLGIISEAELNRIAPLK